MFCTGIQIVNQSQLEQNQLSGFSNCTIILGSIVISNIDLTHTTNVSYPLFPNVLEVSGHLHVSNVIFPPKFDIFGKDFFPSLRSVHAVDVATIDRLKASLLLVGTNLHLSRSSSFSVCVSCEQRHAIYMSSNAFICDTPKLDCGRTFRDGLVLTGWSPSSWGFLCTPSMVKELQQLRAKYLIEFRRVFMQKREKVVLFVTLAKQR